ncbi:MAG: hypothetical protein WC501_02585 [Candidatus Micrarchaeia archaeon]
MEKLKMRNIFALVLVSAFFVMLLMQFSGRTDLMEKYNALNPFDYTYTFGDEISIGVGDKIYYEKGYIQVDALYCGFGGENRYTIVQTDAMSNPQKILIGKTVKISGIDFIVLDKSCENEEKLVMLLKKQDE